MLSTAGHSIYINQVGHLWSGKQWFGNSVQTWLTKQGFVGLRSREVILWPTTLLRVVQHLSVPNGALPERSDVYHDPYNTVMYINILSVDNMTS